LPACGGGGLHDEEAVEAVDSARGRASASRCGAVKRYRVRWGSTDHPPLLCHCHSTPSPCPPLCLCPPFCAVPSGRPWTTMRTRPRQRASQRRRAASSTALVAAREGRERARPRGKRAAKAAAAVWWGGGSGLRWCWCCGDGGISAKLHKRPEPGLPGY